MRIRTWAHAPRDRRLAGQRQTIGVAIDALGFEYQRVLFDSIAHEAREQGVNVIAFLGGLLPSRLFDLIGRENVDALIVVAATIAHQVSPEDLAKFCKRFPDLPICSIGVPVDGLASLVPNGTPGVHALVTHLLTEHGRRKLAFIRGLGEDGAERFEAFKTCLNEFGVSLRQELIVDGKYTQESGREAIRVLCDERRVRFDGVVAADDYMALGAIEALEERGFAVPRDVGVVGFDDIEDARNASVPLTTVQQPIRELGKRAVQLTLRQLAGRALGEIDPIICHPVKRRSCGCVVEAPFTRRPSNPAQQFSSTETALIARRDLVLADMLRTAQGELGAVGYHWEERLFDGITDELRGGSGNPFLSANEELSRRVIRSSGDVGTWQRVLSTLRHHVLDCIGNDRELRSQAEVAFNDAFLVSAAVVGREQSRRRADLEHVLRNVIQTGSALVTSTDQQQVAPILIRHLAGVDVPSCYVSLYEDESRDRAQLVLGYDGELSVTKQDEAAFFDTRQLVPPGLLPTDRSYVYALLPLVYGVNTMGFGLFEYQEKDVILFDFLRDQISGALHAGLQ